MVNGSHPKTTRLSFEISLILVGLMWWVFFLDDTFGLDLHRYGVYPREVSGLVGLVAAPFIHSTADASHILNNSIPTFLFTWMLFYHYRTVAFPTFLFIYLFTGATLWLLGRPSYHIGMSGIIYGLMAFLVVSGWIRKNGRVASLSLVIIFLYGSMVWGIFPTNVGVSWEAHSMGVLSGTLAAIYYRKAAPQPPKMRYEEEEEGGIEPEEEYWKEQ